MHVISVRKKIGGTLKINQHVKTKTQCSFLDSYLMSSDEKVWTKDSLKGLEDAFRRMAEHAEMGPGS